MIFKGDLLMRRNHYTDKLWVAANQNIEAKNFWLKKLSGEPAKSHFPYEHYDRQKKKGTINTLTFDFSGELFSGLMRIAGQSDIKLHIILTAGLMVLLQKYTDNNDIIVGTPIYKQDMENEFINTVLALRNQVPPNITFKEFLLQVRQTIKEAHDNYNYPFEILVEQLNLQAAPGDFPLFDVAILLENNQDKNHINHIPLKMIFSFLKIEAETRIKGIVEYHSLFYEEVTIERITLHFNRLLNQVLFNANTRLGEIDILSPDEKKQLLVDFNRSEIKSDYPAYLAEKTIIQLFERQVTETPAKTAVVFKKDVLTYKELNEKANRMAWFLRKKGASSDSIVAIMMEHSLQMLIGILGVWKTGAAYLPIGADYPQKRVISMLNDSQASIFLTEEKILKKLSFTPLQSCQSTAPGLFITPSRSQVENIDALQMPDRSLVDYEKYRPYIGQAVAKNSITVQFSRGCVYNCAFCFKVWPHKYIVRSAENLFREIQTYYNMGIRRFAFVDDLPNLNIKNSSRFYELIIKHGMKVHFHFPNGIRGDILTKEHIDLMVEAGTVNMDLALETTSPRLQKLIRKRLNLEKLYENIHYIIEKHPQVILELQIIHGLPTETEEEAMASLDYIKNLKWVHFPYIHILNIYPNSAMAEIAMQHGISKEAIQRSADIAYHELPETLPFPKHFTKKYQSEFVSQYFMSKERLLAVLPQQMQVLTEDELVQKYNSYLPVDIHTFSDLLNYAGISRQEISGEFLPRDFGVVPDFNEKLQKHFTKKEPGKGALRLLLLDLSQYFSHETRIIYDVVEPPLGLMYLLTHLHREFPGQIHGKIAKSRIDFDNYDELKSFIQEFNPQVIGIRSLNFYKEFFHQTISIIRQWGISVPIIAGGPYATSSYAAMMRDHNIDLAVLGEGEITFAQLIGKILENNHQLPPEETLKNIPGLAFIQQKEKSLLKENNREIVIMDQLSETLLQESVQNPGNVNNPADLAYIIYTSGSTGTPKGVMIRHDNLFHQITSLQKRFKFDAHLNYMLLAAFTFDVSVMHICLPLTTGAKLFLIDELTRKDPLKLWKFIYDNKIDILNIVPAFMKALLENLEKHKYHFKYLFVGGDVFKRELYHALKETFKAEKIINIYGPTETTINATLYECREDSMEAIIPIGKPLPDYKVYILDSQLSLLPLGAAGELCISGYSVARGYLNRPELTAEKFIPNPCTRYRSNKSYMSYIYRTGDLVRWRQDGNIQFLGRIDQQVKIRGFRIELGEIEKKLKNHKDIKDAVVVARQDNEGDKYLTAYIVPIQMVREEEPLIAELKEYISRELPGYMVPPYFVKLEKIPLNVNGKVDKKALPSPERTKKSVYSPPRNQMEETLVDLWSTVIGINKTGIGIDTNFFELGGHSLKATILISKIHKELDVKVPLVELFRTPFIRGLAAYIKSLEKDKFISIQPVEKKEYYALSSAQKRLYFLHQMDMNTTTYNLPLILPLKKDIQIDKLETTLKKLLAKHESLRTSFITVSEEHVQKIHEPGEVEFEIEYYDLHRTQVEVEEEETGTHHSFVRPFDLSQAPLIRSGIIKLPGGHTTWIVDIHHIVSDGTSQTVLVRDFLSLYNGKELKSLRLQYKDFSQWQNHFLASGAIKARENYWLGLFPDIPDIPRLNLPNDYKRPEAFTFTGDHYGFTLPRDTAVKFKALGAQHGATLFMNMLAALNTLFYKYTGQTDIIIGTAIAGRSHADLQNIIGMFVNTLALRNTPGGEKTYQYLLKEVIARSIKAFENQDLQFEELVDKLDLEKDLSRNPLFDISIVVHKQEEVEKGAERLIAQTTAALPPMESAHKISRFDLTFLVDEYEEDIQITIEYYTGIFKKETIQRLASHFQNVIRAVINDPLSRLKDIEIISAEEKNQILRAMNDTAVNYPKNKTLHELFEKQVEKTPDNIAVIGPLIKYRTYMTNMTYISYRELNQQANRMAYSLITKGVKPDSIAGIMVERSIEMIIGILGILKAGGAYLPIDPEYPQERIDYMLKDSAAKILLTSQEITDLFEPEALNNRPKGTSVHPSTLLPFYPSSSSNLAYVIYTSGTTGRPKGTLIEHRNVVSLMFHENYLFDFNSNDVWTMFHTYCFDFSVWEMYGALLYGGKLVLIPMTTARDPQQYLAILKKENVTILNQTPPVFYNLAQQELESPGKKLYLRYIIFGGEALNPGKLKNWKQKYPGTKLINMFGITETTVHVTFKKLEDKDIESNISNIGQPLPTLSTFVIDMNLNLVPPGVPGELCVGGKGVCRGYLNRPELTPEKFVENPHLPGERFYRSGDSGKLTANGELEYLGRIDHQVKIRGHRIELGEIEAQLAKLDNINQAVVLDKIVGSKSKAEKSLCAYVVSKGKKELDIVELKNKLAQNLPDYMIPLYVVQIEKIPLTANGKVNRKALPEPGVSVGKNYIAPGNDTEKRLVETWSRVLDVEKGIIGIDSSFFDLGGHSLKATILIARVYKDLNVKIPLTELFKAPTIRKMAQYIINSTGDRFFAIEAAEKKEYYELSSAQKRLYVTQQKAIESTAYNMPGILYLEKEPEKDRLEKTLRELIERHESLRTSFQVIDRHLVQQVHDMIEFEVEYQHDLNIYHSFVRPFDLSKAPLLRLGLITTQDDRILLVDMHHIISDGISHQVLREEFHAIYDGKELAGLRLQYKDYSQWQNSDEQKERLKRQESYWLKEFAGGIPSLNLSTDYPRPTIQSFEGSITGFEIEAQETRQLKEIAAREGATLFMVLLAIYNIFLAKITNQEDIVVGTVVNGRGHPDLERIIGMFVNTLALLNHPGGEKTFKEFIKEIKTKTIQAFENQAYPFDELVEKLQKTKEENRNPIFDVRFTFNNIEPSTGEPPGVKPGPDANVQNTSKFDMTLAGREVGEKLHFSFEYCTKLFKEETIKQFSHYFREILSTAAKNINIKLQDIKLSQDFIDIKSNIDQIDLDF